MNKRLSPAFNNTNRGDSLFMLENCKIYTCSFICFATISSRSSRLKGFET